MRAIFPGSDVLACLPDLENSEEDKRFGLVRGIGLQTGIFGARNTDSGEEDFAKSQVGMSLRERVQRQNGVYLFCCSPADSSCSSSPFCQLELGLYSFIALARTSVFLPRSF